MEAKPDHRLGWALAISLAAHGLALLSALGPPPPESSAPLQASLRHPAAPPGRPPPAMAPPESAVAPAIRPALPEPTQRTYEKPPAAASASASSPVAESPKDVPPPVAAPASRQAEAGAAPPQDAAPVQPVRPGVDLHGLRQYHLALSRMAARFKRYPAQAREAGAEGRVPLRLVVSEAGMPVRIVLIGTSGSSFLDQAALEMMGLAASHTPVPESLLGRSFTIDLAVNYNLQDEE
jgi:protein TonB